MTGMDTEVHMLQLNIWIISMVGTYDAGRYAIRPDREHVRGKARRQQDADHTLIRHGVAPEHWLRK